ncbi:putative ORFan [Tupanvirus deep ocean]|uniref:ORFan n=2 Tax=Tupanvirus TaxID=2094720 RepID=A0AC62A923_9VIRU|nr:putative ORFan [Tupanvirus deep ocean]QKU34118.1 putative ORFan [Tupanvirus deep ocean]
MFMCILKKMTSKYYVVLNIIDPTGRENCIIDIQAKIIRTNSSRKKGEIFLSSDYPFSKNIIYFKDYNITTFHKKIKFLNILDSVEINIKPLPNAVAGHLKTPRNCGWNHFVHSDHKIEIQIWNSENKIDSILLEKIKNMQVVPILLEYIGKFRSFTKILQIPKNVYGLVGFEFNKQEELYNITAIHVENDKIHLFEKQN